MPNENLIGVLNDLVEINNDRIKGYEKAIEELKGDDLDLKALFNRLADQSRDFKSELSSRIGRLGGEVSTDTTNLGKIYRAWMDVKAGMSNDDRQTVLNSCEYGEDAAQKAYDSALKSDADMDTESRQMITNQKQSLKAAHDQVKALRDAHETVK